MNTDRESHSLIRSYLCLSVSICGLAVILVLLALSTERVFASEAGDKEWKLVWHDEFSGRKLDSKKWNVLTREQSKHNELQYYLPEEVYVEQGYLHLRSRERNFGSQRYTSGRVYTKDKFAPVYGRFEI